MNSSNKHLKNKIAEIKNFTDAHNNPPADLYDAFLMELKLSRLYLPADYDHEDVDFEHLESDDGIMILPLYTAPGEYRGENELKNFGFEFFAEIIADCEFNGCVIDPNSDEFFVPSEFTETLRTQPGPDVNEDEIYDAYELKELAATVKNEELVRFIQDDSNFNRFDELIDILSRSALLNVVSSPDDLSEVVRDGILITLEVGGFSLSVKSEGMKKYGLMFTSADAIRQTCDTDAGLHYYYQITSFNKILKYILSNDLEGMIIDPYSNDYYVPRNVLIDIYQNHPEIMHNPKFMGGTFFAFEL